MTLAFPRVLGGAGGTEGPAAAAAAATEAVLQLVSVEQRPVLTESANLEDPIGPAATEEGSSKEMVGTAVSVSVATVRDAVNNGKEDGVYDTARSTAVLEMPEEYELAAAGEEGEGDAAGSDMTLESEVTEEREAEVADVMVMAAEEAPAGASQRAGSSGGGSAGMEEPAGVKSTPTPPEPLPLPPPDVPYTTWTTKPSVVPVPLPNTRTTTAYVAVNDTAGRSNSSEDAPAEVASTAAPPPPPGALAAPLRAELGMASATPSSLLSGRGQGGGGSCSSATPGSSGREADGPDNRRLGREERRMQRRRPFSPDGRDGATSTAALSSLPPPPPQCTMLCTAARDGDVSKVAVEKAAAVLDEFGQRAAQRCDDGGGGGGTAWRQSPPPPPLLDCTLRSAVMAERAPPPPPPLPLLARITPPPPPSAHSLPPPVAAVLDISPPLMNLSKTASASGAVQSQPPQPPAQRQTLGRCWCPPEPHDDEPTSPGPLPLQPPPHHHHKQQQQHMPAFAHLVTARACKDYLLVISQPISAPDSSGPTSPPPPPLPTSTSTSAPAHAVACCLPAPVQAATASASATATAAAATATVTASARDSAVGRAPLQLAGRARWDAPPDGSAEAVRGSDGDSGGGGGGGGIARDRSSRSVLDPVQAAATIGNSGGGGGGAEEARDLGLDSSETRGSYDSPFVRKDLEQDPFQHPAKRRNCPLADVELKSREGHHASQPPSPPPLSSPPAAAPRDAAVLATASRRTAAAERKDSYEAFVRQYERKLYDFLLQHAGGVTMGKIAAGCPIPTKITVREKPYMFLKCRSHLYVKLSGDLFAANLGPAAPSRTSCRHIQFQALTSCRHIQVQTLGHLGEAAALIVRAAGLLHCPPSGQTVGQVQAPIAGEATAAAAALAAAALVLDLDPNSTAAAILDLDPNSTAAAILDLDPNPTAAVAAPASVPGRHRDKGCGEAAAAATAAATAAACTATFIIMMQVPIFVLVEQRVREDASTAAAASIIPRRHRQAYVPLCLNHSFFLTSVFQSFCVLSLAFASDDLCMGSSATA
ncbi:hypothetical protein VOLCADRAFT_92524 [Volvox carteri f. nagariensis]|uniref:Uncharacterized protein n=1 Tax=Volvox carteri f. nagariensis TaxID=3068 RepID=D8TZW2_VOLCA|nr:uncharacterized protein VOLCADRAFT_92524 [Volvox carteri f. nagariensis]EFJ46995.1 hypothetical protein VOLCADRAFT_92524 [Volvox carteri f. nagariensis]|eukprot:XP_002951890.1 hypothetical protein VOLCADRAFT_92524 [Volvox carteri f. nagariensis]